MLLKLYSYFALLHIFVCVAARKSSYYGPPPFERSVQSNPEEDSDSDDDISIEIQPRIASGRFARVGDLPYHVQLRYLNEYICGGALVISPHGQQIVLTAANCITEKNSMKFIPYKYIAVWAGRSRLNGWHIFEQAQAVVHVNRHPDYRRTPKPIHDIAILHLHKQFDLNKIVSPVRLPEYTDIKPTGKLVISGWGFYYHTQKEYAQDLQVAAIEIEDWNKCNDAHDDHLNSLAFCAGKIRNPSFQGACLGDEGSPGLAFENRTKNIFLAGIYSWGTPRCGNRYKPSVYTAVSYYIRWIVKYGVPYLP